MPEDEVSNPRLPEALSETGHILGGLLTGAEVQLLLALPLAGDASHIRDRLLFDFARRETLLDAVGRWIGNDILLWSSRLSLATECSATPHVPGQDVFALTAICNSEHVVRIVFGSETIDLRRGDCLLLPATVAWRVEAPNPARLLCQAFANPDVAAEPPGPVYELRGTGPRRARGLAHPPPRGPHDRHAISRSIVRLGSVLPGEVVLAGRTDILNDIVVAIDDGRPAAVDGLAEELRIGTATASYAAAGDAPTLDATAGPALRFRWTGVPQGTPDPLPAQTFADGNGGGPTVYLSRLDVCQKALEPGERLPRGLLPSDLFVVLHAGALSVAGEVVDGPALVALPCGTPIDVAASGTAPATVTIVTMTGERTALMAVPTPAEAPPVVFCIPLIARATARDWDAVCRHLDATVRSIYAQTDPNWRILVVGDDLPDLTMTLDARFEFVAVDRGTVVGSLDQMRSDAGYKRWLAEDLVRRRGDCVLMFCDADDLIERRLVDFVRRTDHPYGYVAGHGLVFDAARRLLGPLPAKVVATRSFDELCGTCAIFRLTPAPDDAGLHIDRDISRAGHMMYRVNMYRAGRPLMELPFAAVAYVRFTTQNLSDADVAHRDALSGTDDRLAAIMQTEPLPLDDETNRAFGFAALVSPKSFRKRLSVVVCTHNRPDGLADLLATLRPQIEGRADRELIVVNDGSHSAAYEAVLAPYGALLRYEPLPESVGIARARNRSTELARGEFLVFTDDDCVVPPHWLDWLCARLDAHPELDVLAGTTRARDIEAANFIGRVQAHYELLPRPYPLETGEQLFVTACLAVRAEVFRAAGGFNTAAQFAIAGEDSELSARLQRRLARARVDFNWHVFHVLSRSLGGEMRRFRKYGYANALMANEHTAPRAYRSLTGKRLRDVPRQFLHHVRRNRPQSAGFSGNPLVRTASLVVLAAIQTAYDEGCVAGSREWVRRQALDRQSGR